MNSKDTGMILLDNKLKIRLLDKRIIDFFGLSPKEHIGQSLFEVEPFSSSKMINGISLKSILEEVVLKGENRIIEPFVSLCDSGERKRFRIGASPLTDDRNEAAGVILSLEVMDEHIKGEVHEDISRRKDFKRALEQHYQNLERVVTERTHELKETTDFLNQVLNSSVSYSIVTTDSQLRITLFNTGAERMFGYRAGDVSGRELSILTGDEDGLNLGELTDIVRREGFYEGERGFVTASGARIVGLFTLAPLEVDSQEEVRGYLSIIRDITQQKTLEQQLIRSEKLAATGKMAASIAHEIINPLYGIQGCLRQLLDDLPHDYANYDFVNIALKETNRIADLLRQMQDFYRPVQDRIVPSNINLIIHEVLSLNRKYLMTHNIQLKLHLQPNMPNIVVSFNQMKQVFINLLYNAVEAMPKGGELRIHSSLKEDIITIIFQDTGVGIRSEEIDNIFEPFFTTKSEVKGVGLGLSVTYGIIQGHDGEILVESLQGKGTKFTIHLPLNPAERIQSKATAINNR